MLGNLKLGILKLGILKLGIPNLSPSLMPLCAGGRCRPA